MSNSALLSYKITQGGTVPIAAGSYTLPPLWVIPDDTRLLCEHGVTLHFPEVGAGNAAFSILGSRFSIEGFPAIFGPRGGVYVANECAIRMIGGSTSARLTGLNVSAEISNFGAYGIFAKWVDRIDVSQTYVHDVGYSGATFLSCNQGVAIGFRAKDISPGTDGHAYGISLTHDSTDYDQDPHAGTPQAANPFCQDWFLMDVAIENIPLWVGIDGHGGYNIKVIGCTTYNCRNGIHIASGSGDAIDYGGWDNWIVDCLVDNRQSDGSPGESPNRGIGINMSSSSGAIVPCQRGRIRGNTVYGYGLVDNIGGTPAIGAAYSHDIKIEGNTVQSWGGIAVDITQTSPALVHGNFLLELADPADTNGVAILNRGAAAAQQTIAENVLSANGGTAATVGFRTEATSRPFIGINDFGAATVEPIHTSYAAKFFSGNGGIPMKSVSLGNAGGSTTVDLSEFSFGTAQLTLVLTASAPITVTNMAGVPAGTVVMIDIAPASSTITYDRGHAVLAGGVNFTGIPYATLVLKCVAISGVVQWVEQSRSTNS